ncbi:cytochrome c1 [Caulobacter mirabilis]|uniref:Cytochrome c1 n=1 Tax=Caulobacter mirabilis TaxID=69666 RepID=A0A2D2AUV3_9CAUL|nr:cytochrome c1 [Caulobacter mirabilis]ATQ41778.1 cytochrome c1 [Caulobacter mirabilis]
MLRKLTFIAAALTLVTGPALAAGHPEPPKDIHFSFEGPFGKYDAAQLQRGYKVYREVCAACHSMNLLAYRNLGDKGGPFYNSKYKNPNDNPVVKALAADAQIDDIDHETGDAIKRPGIPADRFPHPFPNDYAARASNGGALPPDLSVMGKARTGGPEYIASLLQGYPTPPAGLTVPTGQHYNVFFAGDVTEAWKGDKKHVPAGGFIAMAPPLKDGLVSYDDGVKSTVKQQAEDVAAFIMWASEPKMEDRKQMGLAVIIFLLLFSGLLYASYRQVWRNESH